MLYLEFPRSVYTQKKGVSWMELLAYVCVFVYIYIYLISATPYITCSEIVSNSNCDLKSQLGFLVEE